MSQSGSSSPSPRLLIAQSPMTLAQFRAVAMCVILNALDGFDVLSISFAAPGIAAEWGLDRAALGIVLSMELIGMAVGSILLGQAADRWGRRPTAIGCLVVMATGMFATTYVTTIDALAATRLLTGFGIGGMLAATNALVAEYTNDRWRGAAVALMAAGYPLGAVVGGSIASALLTTGTWRDVFTFGAVATIALLPLMLLFLPEPVGSILQRRPVETLGKVNRSLRALGHQSVAVLPPVEASQPKAGLTALFSPALYRITLLLTLAYFLHVITFYFIMKWIPKIVADMGFSPSAAGGVLVWASLGGLLGGLLFSLLSLRFTVRGLLVAATLASAAMVVVFGQGRADLTSLSWAAVICGFCTNAGMVGLYALAAASFPTAVRSGGTGLVIGIGRGGAVTSPIVAGYLFQAGLGLGSVTAIMAGGSLVAALAILLIPKENAADTDC